MSESDSPERSSAEVSEQTTQLEEASDSKNEKELTEQKSYLELHTPQILASMEAVVTTENDPSAEYVPDTMCQIFGQSVVPFFLGGCGSIAAGLLLTYANKRLQLLREVPEFLVLMPPLQGLRGNLDMTFSARMSTLAHVGAFDEPGLAARVWRNAAVAQALSIFVCIIANLIALVYVPENDPQVSIVSNSTLSPNLTTTATASATPPSDPSDLSSFLFLTSSSIISMAVNCALCTLLLFTVVYCAWRRKCNPDNVVAPLGASISDLLTIGSMLLICYLLRPYSEFHNIIPLCVIVLAISSVPVWIFLAWNDDAAVPTARQQCITLIVAATISCGAGAVQSIGALRYPNYPAYQTLISGLTGNRGAVLASRISSYLEVNQKSDLDWSERIWPLNYFLSKDAEAKTAWLLLWTAIPFQLLFVGLSSLASYVIDEPVEFAPAFFVVYSLVVLVQQCLILYLAQLLVFAVWQLGFNPDIHAIPMLTSAADVCGCGLLFICFYSLDRLFGCVKVNEA
ncbi:unnamed protein product [Caenorhabditis sp. 36 PRJEB53466]|nr:unnamed protein product [Caenorhabditis sp. 36 PRJEB53466]